jgi:hypothetical protein
MMLGEGTRPLKKAIYIPNLSRSKVLDVWNVKICVWEVLQQHLAGLDCPRLGDACPGLRVALRTNGTVISAEKGYGNISAHGIMLQQDQKIRSRLYSSGSRRRPSPMKQIRAVASVTFRPESLLDDDF